jgi:hypothetical protein
MTDPIKDAFSKVKDDMKILINEIIQIKESLRSIEDKFNEELGKLHSEISKTDNSTKRLINTTDSETSTHPSTVRQEIEGSKTSNLRVSIGNDGASTDRQTDTSTDTSTHIYKEISPKDEISVENDIFKAAEILDSLDSIKKDIRMKFKRLTSQEMAVFSTIYQIENENPEECTYKNLSLKLSLSESSIRDYVQRMIDKGIPIQKNKVNNKKIYLSISPELKKITTLPQIIQLRDL